MSRSRQPSHRGISTDRGSVDRFHIAKVLNHRSVTHSTVTAIDDRYRYDKEKRAALETRAAVLAGIVGLQPKEEKKRRAHRAPHADLEGTR
jgi:hypothetical protein